MVANIKTVSAIVPVYNEEKTVGKVIETLLASPLVSEVICVNDGSTDKSWEVLKSFAARVKLIDLETNHGKSFAVAQGLKVAQGEIIAFFDSDLVNFSQEHIQDLLEPILNGKVRAVLGVNAGSDGYYLPWEKYLAGERAYFRQDFLEHWENLAWVKGAGAGEIFLNSLFQRQEIQIVPLKGLKKPAKQCKWPLILAFKQWFWSLKGIFQEIKRSGRNRQKIKNILLIR